MAITAIDYSIVRGLRAGGLLPLGGAVLELGEANWYGDVGLNDLRADIEAFASDAHRQPLLGALDRYGAERNLFGLAKLFWATFTQSDDMTAIDLHGGPAALKLNLNEPVDLGRQFEIVTNLGTIEHVFNVARALETIHDHAKPGGLMLHGMPLSGWVDHGFYSFNPTLYWDLAAANGYQVVGAFYTQLDPFLITPLPSRETVGEMAGRGEIGANSLIYVVFRQAAEPAPFRAPMQGYYADALSPEAAERWRTAR
jgi:hypothetical protein